MSLPPTRPPAPRDPEERERDCGRRGAPVVPQDPPPWIARMGAWATLVAFGVASIAVFVVRIPDTVEGPLEIQEGTAPERGDALEAVVLLEERSLTRFATGQRVRLALDAFPVERFGTVTGTLVALSQKALVTSTGKGFVAFVRLDAAAIGAGAERRPLRVGMKGTARVVVGERSIAEVLFGVR